MIGFWPTIVCRDFQLFVQNQLFLQFLVILVIFIDFRYQNKETCHPKEPPPKVWRLTPLIHDHSKLLLDVPAAFRKAPHQRGVQ